MKKFLINIIKFYKKAISPILVALFSGGCRYTPTCSEYAMEAIDKHGAAKGTLLSIKRVGRCHPFSKGYIDPVPGN